MSAQAGAAARDDDPLRKVRDLESAVHDLANMVGVVADRIEDAFKKENKTDANTYYLAQDEVERTLFCAYHAHKMAEAFVDDLLATF